MFLDTVSVSSILATIERLLLKEGEVLLLLVGEQADLDYDVLIERLNEAKINFFGGVFPGILYRNIWVGQGAILKKFKMALPPILVDGDSSDHLEKLQELKPSSSKKLTGLTFVDGLNPDVTDYLEQINNLIGDRVTFLGGGAGYLNLGRKPCIFSNEGFYQDAAVLCVVESETHIGVSHGWRELYGPVVATKTEANVIYELNWEPAFKVYKDAVEEDCGEELTKHNFFQIANRYPFGMFREDTEKVVRDPIELGEKGELTCIGEIPSNTVLYILKGEKSNLIDSAEDAIQACISRMKKEDSFQHTLVIDCITRALFLGNDFKEELLAMQRPLPETNSETIPQGILSLGEISSDETGALEFHNKTIVVGLMS